MKDANSIRDKSMDSINAMLKDLPADHGAAAAELYAARLEGFVEGLQRGLASAKAPEQ